MSGKGLSNLSRLLFGRQLCQWWETGARWYVRLKPYLSHLPATSDKPAQSKPVRGRGLDIRFVEKNPLPDFWLRKAKIDMLLAAGHISGDLANLSDAPALVGKPTVLRLLGRNLERLGSLSLLGRFDFTRPGAARHKLTARVAALQIENLSLEGLDKLPLEIKKGLATLALDLSASGHNLNARLNGQLTRLKLGATTTDTGMLREFARALEKVRSFAFQVRINKNGPELVSRLSSDIDQVLKKAVAGSLSRESARLAKDLESGISEKLAGPLVSVREKTALLGPVEKEISKRLNLGNDLLKGLKLPF